MINRYMNSKLTIDKSSFNNKTTLINTTINTNKLQNTMKKNNRNMEKLSNTKQINKKLK